MPPVARWLYFIGWIFGFAPSVLDRFVAMLHGYPSLAIERSFITQSIAFLLWGTAFLITSVVLQRHEPQPFLSMQPSLWVGLLCLALIPTGAILALQGNHALSEGPVTDSISLSSLIASFFCLVLAVYFWWRKHLMAR